MKKYLLVAAIDFGTTYSGWGFSFTHQFERDPVKVSSKNWTGGPTFTPKTPTCVLIQPDGKTLESFGYDAEAKYAALTAENCHNGWYFFRRFKMKLYGQLGIDRKLKLEDISGKKLLAKTVFALAIKYLKDDLVKTAANQIGEETLGVDDIRWVLTVPAIWNDAARYFMRQAAEEAGVISDHLIICLEPEAASIFCRHLPVKRETGEESASLATLKPGTKYLVIDAGGGTVDITAHEILPDNNLRELHKATGGDWGGTKIDAAFENFLGEIFGRQVLSSFKETALEDYLELIWDFEMRKRNASMQNREKVTIRFSASFSDVVSRMTCSKVIDCVMKSKYKDSLVIKSDKLRMDASVMDSFFRETTQHIVDHVANLLNEQSISGCSAIVMVGGFSESRVLQEIVKEKFGGLKIVIPEEAGLAVLKGAVIYGHIPDLISARVCRFTYGKRSNHIKDLSTCKHPPTREEIDGNGDIRCKDLFKVLVQVGQTVKIGQEGEENKTAPITDDQTKIAFHLYCSPDPNPKLVTEAGCKQIGKLVVDIPDTSLGRNRIFKYKMIFWGTEIQFKCEDLTTGEIKTKYVDFQG